jgi:hypothetical protein
MFKWICLGVGALFLAAVVWMINDIRVQLRRSAQTVDSTVQTLNSELPAIVQRSKQTSETVATNLPEVVDKIRTVTETVAKTLPPVVERVDRTTEVMSELAEDVRQLKELAGLTHTPRDKSVTAYATSLLSLVESSGGEIGLKKTVGRGLKDSKAAVDWVRTERREVLFLTLLGRSKKELLNGIVKTKLGFNWYIQIGDKPPVKLLDWLRENHPETKAL